MIDYRIELLDRLSKIGFPVKYELNLTNSSQSLPCLSYYLMNDYVDKTSDIMGYNYITFSVKIWTNYVADFADIAPKIDKVMREWGFTRTATNELWQDHIGQMQLVYRGLAKEYY